ncbi:MAG: DUF1553 domain-containing protein [Bryobacteraceae bacterium]
MRAYAGSLFLAAMSAAASIAAVQVEIHENVPAGQEFAPTGDPSVRYAEPAAAFVYLPVKYSPEALPLDRSVPFVLRATSEQQIGAGKWVVRLRARGAAVLRIDGKEVARTEPQKPNKTGDDPVPAPPVPDTTGHRPLQHPHQDAFFEMASDGRLHRFEILAVIGGKGLMPTPGELAVAIGRPGEIQRLLGDASAPTLTDEGWGAFASAQRLRHEADDRARRLEVSRDTRARWEARHAGVRRALEQTPAPAVPDSPAAMPANNPIDRFVNARLAAENVAQRPLTSDIDFLRRASLDIKGVIPTPAEIARFLADPASQRRHNAIERFLADDRWADNWVPYWQDVLAENPGILKPDLNNTGPFRYWIYQSFRDGVPFDRFVAELVQMEGSQHRGAPAAFAQATLNDAPMAAKADILAQAFLGQKLGCARCHDAPFHPFKQKDLFSLSAMLAGKPVKLPATSTVPMREGARKPAVTVTLKPGEQIDPAWPFDSLAAHAETGALPSAGKVDSRRELAALIIAPQNERFAKVVVNRVWKRYMGVGFVEPADDWSRAKASHPELLAWLAREFVMSGYDLKHVSRLIFESHAYQRRAIEGLADTQMQAKNRLFAGPLRRKMSAEQIVDSLHQSVGKPFECEELNLNPAGDRAPNQFLNMGMPDRAWQLTALSNERDRPALALPIAQSLVDVMTAYGWRQSRQSPASARDDASSPMQTLILANGILATRLVRLSDDSFFTELALKNVPVETMVREAFLRILSREPAAAELKSFADLLRPAYGSRVAPGVKADYKALKSDTRVSWSNHLSAEATVIRMEEEKRLRMGAPPTKRLRPEFRERYEDVLWAMVNSPEFVLMP